MLASGSPRRAKILADHGVDFEVLKTDAPETVFPADPIKTVTDNALSKLQAALKVVPEIPEGGVLAADTIVWLKGSIYGKPVDLVQAARFLRELGDEWHSVFTGVAYADSKGTLKSDYEESQVKIRKLSDKAIDEYLTAVNPIDRAGAYDIDESGEMVVETYSGSYENIMGLPFALLERMGIVPHKEG